MYLHARCGAYIILQVITHRHTCTYCTFIPALAPGFPKRSGAGKQHDGRHARARLCSPDPLLVRALQLLHCPATGRRRRHAGGYTSGSVLAPGSHVFRCRPASADQAPGGGSFACSSSSSSRRCRRRRVRPPSHVMIIDPSMRARMWICMRTYICSSSNVCCSRLIICCE